MHCRRVLPILLCLSFSACNGPLSESSSPGDNPLTSVEGVEYTIDFESFVYVPAGADEGHVKWQIQRQVKSALGALREVGIGIMDRDAEANLSRDGWRLATERLTVVNADGTTAEEVDRVTYHYTDTALVQEDQLPSGPLPLTLLFGDYPARRDELVPDCSDDSDAAADSLWYHYSPGRWRCASRISDERDAIADATAELDDANTQIGRSDSDRRFVSMLANLDPVEAAGNLYPEYDRLWGFRDNTSRNMLVVYAFFGVDSDEGNPGDYGLREFMRFQRTLLERFPSLHVTHTEPFAMLLDFWIDGELVQDVGFADVQRWILDNTGYPPEVGSDQGKRDELKRQVVERFAERWIYWQLPVEVSDGQTTRHMTVEIRSFYGYEDGGADVRQRAQWRYLEAFWHADVFAYTGHSHFGHGPLAPWYYNRWNFPSRYQVMLINSCLSFNYYDQDFLDIHPGGSEYLDIVVNGLSAYWSGMGEATGNFVASLIDGEDKTWRELLDSMRVDLPWNWGYDPMRAVNGELDNTYSGANRPLTVTPL